MKLTTRFVIAGIAAVGFVVSVAMILLGMEPRLVLVGCVVVLIAVTALLVTELSHTALPLDWYAHGAGNDSSQRPDRRVQTLQSQLRQPTRRRKSSPVANNSATAAATTTTATTADTTTDAVADSLLAIIDGHLSAAHGVDRAHDPQRAAALLGPELARFVNSPSDREAMTDRRSLARTVSLIEAL